MEKVAIYDFCQTLVDFETADAFIHYIRRHQNTSRMKRIENIRQFLSKTRILPLLGKVLHKINPAYSLNKHWILYELRGMPKTQVYEWAERYYEEIIKEHFIEKTLTLLKEQKQAGYLIVIVSASYEPILQCFANEYAIDCLITNKFRFDEQGRFTGKLQEPDCIGKNKVKRFLREFAGKQLQMEIVFSYGDSTSDIPILKMAQTGYVVNHNANKPWILKNNLEELIW